MTKPMIRIIDGNQITDREMTDEEFSAYKIVQADSSKIEAKQAAKEATQAAAKQDVLDRLGITAEEARMLLS